MKTCFHAFIMCQSMFCAIPAPQIWDEKAWGKMLLFLPIVGLEIGLLWSLLLWFSEWAVLPALLRGILLAAFPFAVTGYIHLDGFMDVTDAVRSCRSPERRREILKDPHVGSFAVIGCVLLVLAEFAVFASIRMDVVMPAGILVLIPVVSRCCSALAITVLPPMPGSQYADQAKPKWHAAVLAGMLLLAVIAGFYFCGKYGSALIWCAVAYCIAMNRARKSLGGMNGDISGYALTISELWGLGMWIGIGGWNWYF